MRGSSVDAVHAEEVAQRSHLIPLMNRTSRAHSDGLVISTAHA